MQVDNWTGLYHEGWGQNRLRPASFAHPAKNSYGLSVRIYEHALEEGWVKAGDYVVDCFSGIGGFALEAMRHGLHFRGVELEQRFVDMGQGCDCTGITKADWVRYQGRWDRMRYEGGRHWCPECLMKAAVVAGERKFKVAEKRKIKPLPLPGTKWGALAKTCQATLFDAAAPTASYVRNNGKIPCTGVHRYHGNIETWEAQGMPGTAVIVQGDSRRLGAVLERARICVSSPPYTAFTASDAGFRPPHARAEFGRDEKAPSSAQMADESGYGQTPGNLGNLPDTGFEAALGQQGHTVTPKTPQSAVQSPCDAQGEGGSASSVPESRPVMAVASPPFGAAETRNRTPFQGGDVADMMSRAYTQDKQGTSPGQLAALPEGSHAEACERPVCAISSPPYGDWKLGSTPIENPNAEKYAIRKGQPGNDGLKEYGDSVGQLAQMPPGDHAEALEAGAAAVISSPPWEGNLAQDGRGTANLKIVKQIEKKYNRRYTERSFPTGNYSDVNGQLGNETGSTFWAASREILEEVYKVLAPGAHAIFVCKRFVRDKKIVEFSTQWAHLCEAVGFKWIHHHKAWLVEEHGAQHTLEGGLERRIIRRFSFFRFIHFQKFPKLAIEYEDVLCFVK